MKIKMLVDCQDRENRGTWFKAGESYDISDERAQAAISAGYAVADEWGETKRGRANRWPEQSQANPED